MEINLHIDWSTSKFSLAKCDNMQKVGESVIQ